MKEEKSNYSNKNPGTNNKTNHDDDLLIVLDMEYSMDSNNFNPENFFNKKQNIPIIVLNAQNTSQYDHDMKEIIASEIKKNKNLNINNIKNVKFIDIQHAATGGDGQVYAHKNDMCIELVKAINESFPKVTRTKMISTACHSETIDDDGKDLRVELYKAINEEGWKKQHKLDLYLTPFNEIDGKFKLNQEGKKIKQHIRLLNTQLAPSLGDDMTTEQKKDARDMLQFMMNGQVYSYIKDTDGKAKISLHIREYEPDNTEEEGEYKFVSLKRKKTEKDQGKKTLKDYCTLKEMSKFLQEYYKQCEKEVNKYFEKYPNSDEEKMKKQLVYDNFDYFYSKNPINYIIEKKGRKWYDDKFKEYQKATNGDMFGNTFVEKEYKENFFNKEKKKFEDNLNKTGLSDKQKIEASRSIAASEGVKIEEAAAHRTQNIECYLPRKIENVQIENENNIIYESRKEKEEGMNINNLQNEEKNKNNITYGSQKEDKKEMNNSSISENIDAGCNCNNCCNLL